MSQNDSNTKKRPAIKCREWEKERRNRFNDAIAQLGEQVKQAINKVCKDGETNVEQTTQISKIDIVQKAIVIMKQIIEEKSQLKAEILALQVKLEAELRLKGDKRDASTQFNKASHTKLNSRYNKSLIVKQCKRNTPKRDINQYSKPKVSTTGSLCASAADNAPPAPTLPIILPKSVINTKRPQENTFVVLPGPYVIPPRPLLFPSAHPTFVLLDPMSQLSNCKTTIPFATRTGTEVTKTTMVNIVPISAYSHPLSLITNKNKTNKIKIEYMKKTSIKQKQSKKVVSKKNNGNHVKIRVDNKRQKSEKVTTTNAPLELISVAPEETSTLNIIENKESTENLVTVSTLTDCNDSNANLTISVKDVKSIVDQEKVNNNVVDKTKDANLPMKNDDMQAIDKSSETKTFIVKDTSNNKHKEKLPIILETTLCENTVDGGNARLELAEEFLAASPTAAFLMSFPLVSGNRADSPADEGNITSQPVPNKDIPQRRNVSIDTPQPDVFYTKTTQIDMKSKISSKPQDIGQNIIKDNNLQKHTNNEVDNKSKVSVPVTSVTIESPFVPLPASTVPTSANSIADTTFSLDFDCNLTKSSIPAHSTPFASNNNFFYNKSDPFNSVKNTVYNSSTISSGHDFNSLSLYPCAMEKYTSKNKTDYTNPEDNLMKIGSSRLTYDIDLGWPHKSFDFVSCTTTSNTIPKDMIFTTASAPFSSFNPEFPVSLGTSANKKEISSKPNPTYSDAISNFYSQPSNFWPDELPFYSNNNMSSSKPLMKQQTYLHTEQPHLSSNMKQDTSKLYDPKINEHVSAMKNSNQVNASVQQIPDKYSKKSPNKMHINWMTSETRPIQSSFTNTHAENKENSKASYGQIHQHHLKKQEHIEPNYFPIQINNLPTQDEFQVWPSSRPIGSTEISIEPPPINLPTLVGDLALGPHEKRKSDHVNRGNAELSNCNNFLSVTQLMNRSSENMPPRYHGNNSEPPIKALPTKQNINQFTNEISRKPPISRLESNFTQPYVYEEKVNNFDITAQYPNIKSRIKPSDKNSKSHKNNYSAEALIRGGPQKMDLPKFIMPTQKYNNLNPSYDGSIAQVSHFPPIIDYTENTYSSQPLVSSHLYSSTTSTISNSFYSNFMPTSSNLMPSNYPSGNHTDFIEYNPGLECNYTNQKYEEFKMRSNPHAVNHDKGPSNNYRNTKRESSAKHKLECSKKDTSKKYPSKKSKISADVEDWSDNTHLLWQNRTAASKKNANYVADELSFPNYANNQMPVQYQSDFFNSHLMPTNVQGMGHNVDRSVTSFPVTSRANFNLSTIFPEITMKVQ